MKPKIPLVLLLVFALLWAPLQGAEVIVSAAASLKDVLAELAPLCQKETGVALKTNLAASGVLAQQVKSGAPVDIFISADDETMDGLEKAGLLQPGTRARLLGNALVFIVPAADLQKYRQPDFIAAPEIKHLAIGDPQTVPAGRYAMACLEKLKLAGAVKDKLVPLDNVRAVLAAVAAGNAEAGIVYRTDAAIEKKVRIAWTVPEAGGPAIHYPVAMLKDAPSAAAAAKVREFLLGDSARAVFARYGFTLPDKPAPAKPAPAASSGTAQ
ncbi:MAG TPA: molybdate ABC transporter substrate-binding protein [Opitutales bacterium]|nr:molybdate ABC transporter substrate-binding protein [Opitutales bacterium]